MPRWFSPACNMALAALLALALALGGLAWRLAEAPLEIPFLARQIEARLNAAPDGPRLAVGRAAIAWEGFRGGTAAPLDIRLSDVVLRGADGTDRISVPEAAATLSIRALLRGTLAPATIELRRPRVLATLAADGGIGLALGPAAAAAEAMPDADPLALLAELMRPVSDRDAVAALRRVRVTGGELTLQDPATGRRWMLHEPQIDLRRAAAGGLAGEGAAEFRAAGLTVPVTLTIAAEGAPMRLRAGISLPALRPSDIATIWAPLAPLSLIDALVSLTASAEFDAAGRPDRMRTTFTAGAGAFDLGPGSPGGEARRLPFTGLTLAADLTGRAMTLREARLTLPGLGGLAGPVLTATGEVFHRDAGWQVTLDLAAGALEASDLPRLWPAALAPEARIAALGALPAGLLRDTRLRGRFRLPDTLDAVVPEQAQLAFGVSRAIVDIGRGRRIAADTADFALSGTPDHLRIEQAVLRLPAAAGPAGPAAAGPTIRAEGSAERSAGVWRGWLGIGLDAVAFADLPGYWPRGLGSPKGGERDWITQNITTGSIRNGRWRIEAEAPEGQPEAMRITALTGTAEASDATVHWLRPVPAAVGVSGTAEFSLKEITLRVRGGRQPAAEGARSSLDLREGVVRFFNLDADPGNSEIVLQVAGPLAEAVTLLKHPRLKLFERRPLALRVAEGQAEARITIGFPLVEDLPVEDLRIRATARVTEAKLPGMLLDQDLDRAAFELAVDTDTLKASGTALLLGAPVKLGIDLDFRRGPATQVVERATLSGRLDARQIAILGFDATRALEGPVALEARSEKRRNGQGQVVLRGDLRDARLGVEALNWAKLPGTAGTADAVLRMQGDALTGVDSFQVEALELSLRGRASFARQSRLERVEITESIFGGSRFTGEVRPPDRAGAAWAIALRGPLADLRPVLGPPGHAEGGAVRPDGAATGAPAAEGGPPLTLDLRFDRVTMGGDRNLLGVQAWARTDARGVLREAQATGRTAARGLGSAPPAPGVPARPGQPGPFEFTLTPRGEQRQLRLVAEDGGGLLHALDLVNVIRGGRLNVTASYAELRPGAPLVGTAELDQFVLSDAPAAAKLLQAMTLYGLVEAAQGGSGLVFSRLVAPFSLTPEALTLADARAFSASLGVTAKGRILRERAIAEVEGTIVPAYVFNTLLGNLPLIGRLFSPEAGGGVFAATYRIQGPLADPTVVVNPLAALTPGFLRGLFGIFDGTSAPEAAPGRAGAARRPPR
ncbi:DUF3971 domain-containing protein [Paeniroseomonas aquatica]|uniref:DUF3971 domain-containing protein n=1 Tax=Paeniroseomonas aquatica TaxID=373043 RepID=A0ABT8AGG6_9PROT|nr:DUF3971 domain-containing protein [Paeniroseomonas aquatica]MDN3568896.1 DUF3971 domain-containing protein [Paeniroseomonas aquatica]